MHELSLPGPLLLVQVVHALLLLGNELRCLALLLLLELLLLQVALLFLLHYVHRPLFLVCAGFVPLLVQSSLVLDILLIPSLGEFSALVLVILYVLGSQVLLFASAFLSLPLFSFKLDLLAPQGMSHLVRDLFMPPVVFSLLFKLHMVHFHNVVMSPDTLLEAIFLLLG